MIFVKESHLADISVTATRHGFRVFGKVDVHDIDMHFSQIISVKYYLRNLESLLMMQGVNHSFSVFDMTERLEHGR